jgi:hypothetical protein
VLDFGVEKRTPFLVMGYAANGTLRQRHPKGTRLPLATVVSYVKQLADALQPTAPIAVTRSRLQHGLRLLRRIYHQSQNFPSLRKL